MNSAFETVLPTLQGYPPEGLWILLLSLCFGTLLILHRLFGAAGLYVYIVVAIIGANLQVLKVVQFSFYPHPVALGTVLFASSYLATDLLTERFGVVAAQRGVWLGFAAYLSFLLIMLATLGFTPLTPDQAGENMTWALPYHQHLAALFTPAPNFFIAGMCAYLISQLHDIQFFHWLRRQTKGRRLWLRNTLSTALSALVDNVVFSVLAWVVLNSHPLPLTTVLFTYILGTYWLRLLVAILDTPFLYLARHWRPHHDGLSRL